MRAVNLLLGLAVTLGATLPSAIANAQDVEVKGVLAHRTSPDGLKVLDATPVAVDYARALTALAGVGQVLPDRQDDAAKEEVRLTRSAENLFSNYDGRFIPGYAGQGKSLVARKDYDPLTQGSLVDAFGQVNKVKDRVKSDDDQHLLKVVADGEPVKGLNFVRHAGLYDDGRFYASPDRHEVTAASTAYGLRYVAFLVDTYAGATGMDHQKFRKLRRFLGIWPEGLLDMVKAVDRDLSMRWDAKLEAYRFGSGAVTYGVADAATLVLDHKALADMLDASGKKDEAAKVRERGRQLFASTFVEGKTFGANGLAATVEVTPQGPKAASPKVDVATSYDAVVALNRWDPKDPTVQKLTALALAAAPRLSSGDVLASEADFATGRVLDPNAGSAVASYLAAAAVGLAKPDAAQQAFLGKQYDFLSQHLEQADAVTARQDDPTQPAKFPIENWMTIALLVGVVGTIFAFIDIYWPRRLFKVTPAVIFAGVGVMVLVSAVAVRGLEYTQESRFCATCHVIRSKFQSVFDPNERTLAAKHYRQDWIKADGHECYACHTRGGGVNGEIKTFYVGAKEVAEYLTGRYDVPVEMTINVSNNCLSCHHRALDPSFISENYHVMFRWQIAHMQMPCYGCHTFHTDEVLNKGVDFHLYTPPHKTPILPALGDERHL